MGDPIFARRCAAAQTRRVRHRPCLSAAAVPSFEAGVSPPGFEPWRDTGQRVQLVGIELQRWRIAAGCCTRRGTDGSGGHPLPVATRHRRRGVVPRVACGAVGLRKKRGESFARTRRVPLRGCRILLHDGEAKGRPDRGRGCVGLAGVACQCLAASCVSLPQPVGQQPLCTACNVLLEIFIHGGFSKSGSRHGKAASVPTRVTVIVITQQNGWSMVAASAAPRCRTARHGGPGGAQARFWRAGFSRGEPVRARPGFAQRNTMRPRRRMIDDTKVVDE